MGKKLKRRHFVVCSQTSTTLQRGEMSCLDLSVPCVPSLTFRSSQAAPVLARGLGTSDPCPAPGQSPRPGRRES